jgi:hypothetical protein
VGLLAALERRHRGPQLPPDQHPAARRQAIHRHNDQGNQAYEEGGYLWEGELRLWDNEILMGWYVATEGAVRSKGSLYFVIHQHGVNMTGRWVGLGYDGPIVTGWGTIAKSNGEVLALMNQLKEKGTVVTA